jgi:hypothetical protein
MVDDNKTIQQLLETASNRLDGCRMCYRTDRHDSLVLLEDAVRHLNRAVFKMVEEEVEDGKA